jgi:hypothetical protein
MVPVPALNASDSRQGRFLKARRPGDLQPSAVEESVSEPNYVVLCVIGDSRLAEDGLLGALTLPRFSVQ